MIIWLIKYIIWNFSDRNCKKFCPIYSIWGYDPENETNIGRYVPCEQQTSPYSQWEKNKCEEKGNYYYFYHCHCYDRQFFAYLIVEMTEALREETRK